MADIGNITVTKLNEYIKYKLEGDLILKGISVEGEISNCKTYSSGHMYFTLKDNTSAVRCVMFKGYRQNLNFEPADGDGVIVRGDISVYTRDGNYQLYATNIRKEGTGALYEKYLELKDKLEKKGLFDVSLKKKLPKYPKKLGVITSDSGAVYHDIMNVAKRRFPLCEIVLFPSRVQGEDADLELIFAIEKMDTSGCDVAIIGRGGGSIEDLWQFNSEKLALAIFSAKTPIISAVGHETDFTICDFVSDLRAPTPSAAAELAVPDAKDIRMQLSSIEDMMTAAVMNRISEIRSYLKYSASTMRQLNMSIDHSLRLRLRECSSAMRESMKINLFEKRNHLTLLSQKIALNDPISLMNKGYAVVLKDDVRVRSALQLENGNEINIKFYDGEHFARIIGGKANE